MDEPQLLGVRPESGAAAVSAKAEPFCVGLNEKVAWGQRMRDIALPPSGVYQIRNKVNGKRYVGSAANFRLRRTNHICQLRAGRHHSNHLQRAFDLYGEDAFVFEVLLFCGPEDLLKEEQRALDAGIGEYNEALSATAPMLGRKHSAKARAKMVQALLNRPEINEATRQRLRAAARSRTYSAETRQRMSASYFRSLEKDPGRLQRLHEKHRGLPVEGTHVDTGAQVRFTHAAAVSAGGFDPSSVGKCLRGFKAEYKKHTWRHVLSVC